MCGVYIDSTYAKTLRAGDGQIQVLVMKEMKGIEVEIELTKVKQDKSVAYRTINDESQIFDNIL